MDFIMIGVSARDYLMGLSRFINRTQGLLQDHNLFYLVQRPKLGSLSSKVLLRRLSLEARSLQCPVVTFNVINDHTRRDIKAHARH
jgi:hypothetical protein